MSRNSTKQTTLDYAALLGDDMSGYAVEICDQYKSAGDAKARAAVRSTVQAAQKSAIEALDVHQAKYWMNTLESLKVDGPQSAPKVDPAQVLADRIATLELAARMLRECTVVPEGMSAIEGTLPEAGDCTEPARKLAGSKITRSGDRQDVGAFIASAFASVETGTVLTVAEIRRTGSTVEGYVPSPGAVRARMEGSGVEGFEPVAADTSAGTPFGVRKV